MLMHLVQMWHYLKEHLLNKELLRRVLYSVSMGRFTVNKYFRKFHGVAMLMHLVQIWANSKKHRFSKIRRVL